LKVSSPHSLITEVYGLLEIIKKRFCYQFALTSSTWVSD
jgi:hypothetical protein